MPMMLPARVRVTENDLTGYLVGIRTTVPVPANWLRRHYLLRVS